MSLSLRTNDIYNLDPVGSVAFESNSTLAVGPNGEIPIRLTNLGWSYVRNLWLWLGASRTKLIITMQDEITVYPNAICAVSSPGLFDEVQLVYDAIPPVDIDPSL